MQTLKDVEVFHSFKHLWSVEDASVVQQWTQKLIENTGMCVVASQATEAKASSS